MNLRVFLAGRVAIESERGVIEEDRFPGRQGRLLFAYLVAEQGRPVPRDELADALWGEAPPATSNKALGVLASKLRGLLADAGIDGGKALTSAFGSYRLNLPDETWVDVIAAADDLRDAENALATDDFDQARKLGLEAASLARAAFLPGEDGAWVGGKRRELTDIHRRALSCLAEASLRSGDEAEAANWAEETITLDPYRETGYRQLMAAHAAAGNRAEALRVYERCRQLLATELGAYPSPETESIYRELLEAPAPEPGAAAAPETAPVAIVEREPPRAESQPAAPVSRSLWRRRRVVIGVLAGVVAAVVIPLFALGGGSSVALGDSNSVGVLDAGSGKVKDAVGLTAAPTAVAAGFRYIWAVSADSNAVFAIDPKTNTVRQEIEVGNAPSGIAVGGDYVWVTNSLAGTVSQIDPKALIELQSIRTGNGPTGVAAGGGYVWVANTLEHTVSKIRASTGKLLKRYPAGTDPGAVAVGEHAVWVASKSSDTVVKLNSRDGQQLARIPVGRGPSAIAVGLGFVWVANSDDGTMWQIDPASNKVVDIETVGANPSGIKVVGGEVWATNELDGTVSRIDPETESATTLRLGGRPTAVGASGSNAYVALRPVGADHRGGTLRVALPNIDGLGTDVDPALAGPGAMRLFLSLTGDGLLAYRAVGGEAGNELVPDLAVPLPSPDGKTYRFRLRRNIRYSDGKLVKASDVRYTFERVLRLAKFALPGPGDVFRGIRGAKSCTSRRCDLSRGIVTDDTDRVVTFHLYGPDPAFRYSLASVTATILPAGTPMHPAKRRPVPATGPYRIDGFSPQDSVRLVRNPQFREWSHAAQPAGFPDQIVGKIIPALEQREALRIRDQKKRIARVEHGEADLTSSHGAVPFSPYVSAPFLPRVHRYPEPVTFYLAFNANRPPFNDPKARRAVNFALDRNRVARLAGGEDGNRPTCQVLPPSFPAYRSYCPYTLDRSTTGSWTAADPDRAGRLVTASGTRGALVTLWVPRHPAGIRLGKYLEQLLEQLGYRVHLRSSFVELSNPRTHEPCSTPTRRCRLTESIGAYFGAVHEPGASPQVIWSGWIADHPDASNFIQPLFSCKSKWDNHAHFCDPRLDRRINRALRLEQTDLAGANRLWTKLDREITNRALWVPLYNDYGADLVSKRVGHYQYNPMRGALLSQLWVR